MHLPNFNSVAQLVPQNEGVLQGGGPSKNRPERESENGAQPYSLFILRQCHLIGQEVIHNDHLKLDYLKRAAKLNELVTAHSLGKIYLDGNEKMQPDGAQNCAVEYLYHSVSVYDPAQECLGFYYRDSFGVKKDHQQSFVRFEQAPGNDDSKDTYVLYLMGDLCSKKGQHEKSFEYFLEAANAGMEAADFKVAQCYANGTGVPRNIPKAIPWLQKCLLKGVSEAGKILSEIYQNNEVGAAQSLEVLKTAAEAGIPAAQRFLICLAIENPILAEPAMWMDIIAHTGDIPLQFMLAGLYYMNQNGAKAAELFQKVIAGQSTDPQAIEGQTIACEYLEEFCQNEEEYYFYKGKALEFYLKISDNPENKYKIGCLYYELEEDLTPARMWFQRAASQNHPEAKKMLAHLFSSGNGS